MVFRLPDPGNVIRTVSPSRRSKDSGSGVVACGLGACEPGVVASGIGTAACGSGGVTFEKSEDFAFLGPWQPTDKTAISSTLNPAAYFTGDFMLLITSSC